MGFGGKYQVEVACFSLEFLVPKKKKLHFIFQERSLASLYCDVLVEFTELSPPRHY